MKNNGRFILFTLILVIVATACKFVFGKNIDWSGFSPVIAIALFSGFIIKRKDMAFLLPLLALFLSDVAIDVLYSQGLFPYAGFYSGQWINYLLLLSTTLIGWALKGNTRVSMFAGAIIAPTVYFLLSNFNVWVGGHVTYPRTFDGLMQSYINGLPFYRNALIGTLVFLPLISLCYNLLTRNKPVLTVA
jgi:hypothetical protein